VTLLLLPLILELSTLDIYSMCWVVVCCLLQPKDYDGFCFGSKDCNSGIWDGSLSVVECVFRLGNIFLLRILRNRPKNALRAFTCHPHGP
jgi:hypothetical protein